MKIALISDTHWDKCDTLTWQKKMAALMRLEVEALVHCGDIAEPPTLLAALDFWEAEANFPMYFALGNHDYYGKHIQSQQRFLRRWCGDKRRVHYLSSLPGLSNQASILMAIDSWYDAYGITGEQSERFFFDKAFIKDFETLNCGQIIDLLKSLWQQQLQELSAKVEQAIGLGISSINILSHIPPLQVKQRALFPRQKEAMGLFTSQLLASQIFKWAEAHSAIDWHLICGHWHIETQYKLSQNCTVHVLPKDTICFKVLS